jgi:DNA-binding transcriptional LysR family regulator
MGIWSDYPIFLAVAQTGSLTAAGKKLGLSQPTVGRRIRALEDHFGMPLLTKDADGLRPTRFGASILTNIEKMQEEADTIARTQASLDSKLEGVVRLSATEGIGTQWMPAVMAEFRSAHPEVLVEMLVGFKQFNLAQREADIALRWGSPGEQNSLFARKVASPRFGLFASTEYVARMGKPQSLEELSQHDGVYAMIHKDHPLWLGAHIDDPTPEHPPGRVTFQTDSIWAFTEAIIHGYGIGLMPLVSVTGRGLPLVRVLPDVAEEEDLWIVAHEDLKRSPRIRAVFDHIVGAFETDAGFFREGGASRYTDALIWPDVRSAAAE